MQVDIQKQLLKQRNKHNKGVDILQQVQEVLAQDSAHETAIKNALVDNTTNLEHNTLNLDLLETNRIFHIEDIKNICITYRLRFLESYLFKNDIPAEAISKIKQLEKAHNTTLGGFKIMAPSKLFRLENYDDPLLFAPIGNGYYYLIHKWGNDLSVWRKWLMYPFRNLDTIIVSTVVAAILIALSFPESYYHPDYKTTQFIFLCFFWFKVIGFCLIFFGVSRGKNFNSAIWDSRYVNR
ncbi:hypothetical protein WJN01_08715 [Flavobacteriaceae bacterium SZ-1-7]|uniref:hypothetical protein n=1 Tax=Tamlana sedimenti TaxID=3134126 RepID=UPI00312867C2